MLKTKNPGLLTGVLAIMNDQNRTYLTVNA
jgi:hypothetical protein